MIYTTRALFEDLRESLWVTVVGGVATTRVVMMALCYCWRGYQWKETEANEDGGGGGGADAVNSDAADADADGDVGDGDVDRDNGGNDVDNNASYHVVKYIMMGWWWY